MNVISLTSLSMLSQYCLILLSVLCQTCLISFSILSHGAVLCSLKYHLFTVFQFRLSFSPLIIHSFNR